MKKRERDGEVQKKEKRKKQMKRNIEKERRVDRFRKCLEFSCLPACQC